MDIVFSGVRFSVIVPLYNRPEEIEELLASLVEQTFQDFEVIVVEDGSERDARDIVAAFSDRLDVHYFWKENTRQGFTRNYGFERAKGEWLVVFDSDCLIPPGYFETVEAHLRAHPEVEVYGGPDAAHPSFTALQKAISHTMTSPLTTGGIRGGAKTVGTYQPRSFNMGISRKAWEQTGGYRISVKGEDIEFSIRLQEHGLHSVLIPGAPVYHKRRTDFAQFRKQVRFFGTARINIRKFYPNAIRPVHWMPTVFLLYVISMVPAGLVLAWGLDAGWQTALLPALPYVIWHWALFFEAWASTGSLQVAALVPKAARIQLTAYGWGLLSEYVAVVVLKRRDPTIGDIRQVPRPNPQSKA